MIREIITYKSYWVDGLLDLFYSSTGTRELQHSLLWIFLSCTQVYNERAISKIKPVQTKLINILSLENLNNSMLTSFENDLLLLKYLANHAIELTLKNIKK
jgi:hypothetical protein